MQNRKKVSLFQKFLDNHMRYMGSIQGILLILASVLSFGHGRTCAISYGWSFLVRKGWYFESFMALVLFVPPVVSLLAWVKICRWMARYDQRYDSTTWLREDHYYSEVTIKDPLLFVGGLIALVAIFRIAFLIPLSTQDILKYCFMFIAAEVVWAPFLFFVAIDYLSSQGYFNT